MQTHFCWVSHVMAHIRVTSDEALPGVLFVGFDSLCPINNLSVIKGRVFMGCTSTKLGLMFLLKDITQ